VSGLAEGIHRASSFVIEITDAVQSRRGSSLRLTGYSGVQREGRNAA